MLIVLLVGNLHPSPARASPVIGLTISNTLQGLSIDWTAPSVQISLQAGGVSRITLPGFEQLKQPGVPEVPFSAVLIAIPQGGEAILEIQQVEETLIPLSAPVARAGRPQGVLRSEAGQAIGGAFTPSPEIVSFSPPPLALETVGVLRGIQIARLIFYPARPIGTDLRLTTRVRASLSFNLPVSSPAHLVPSRDPLVEVLKSAVVNPRDVVQSPRMVVTPAPEPLKTDVSSTKAAIEVGQTGLTQITYENLSSSGFPVTSVNPLNLHLSRAGKEVAYEWDGDGDAKFELNERLLFYAAPRFSRYASFDVYFVEERDSPGLLMGNRTADPAGFPIGAARVEITAEENRIYTPDCFCAPIPAGRDGDRWVWDRLQIDSHPLESYLLELHGVDPSQPATLNLWLIGYTDVAAVPDHHVKVSLNGTPIGDLEWDGKGSFSASFIILGSLLVNGSAVRRN